MKKQNLKQKVATIVAIPAITLMAGCMANDAVHFKLAELNYERKGALAYRKENEAVLSEQIYRKSQVFQQNSVPVETVHKAMDSSFMESYKNRKQ